MPGHLREHREVRERGPEPGGLGRDVRAGVDERVAEHRRVARWQLALDLATGGRGRERVEVVEEARDRVRALGIELDRRVRLGRRNRSRSCSGGTTSTIWWAAAPRPFEVDIFRPPMFRNS